MDATNDEIRRIYSKHWSGSEDALRAALGQDSWYNAEEAVQVGLADRVVDAPALAARVNSDFFNYQNVPADVALGPGPFVPAWRAAFGEKLTAAIGGANGE